jgi:gliding motility-associated-like protein
MSVGADSSVFAYAGRDTVVCHNSTVELNGTGSVNATGYAWYLMPGMVLIKDTSVVFVTPTNDTTTYVLVVSHGLCTDTSRVTIVSLPALSLNPGPDQVIYGTGTVTLGGSPTASSYTSLVWEPNSTLNDSVYANPAATPTVTTIYTVTVENSAGCKASDTVTVFVLPGINPPSGFTPNGDGVNDYWVLGFAVDFPNIVVEVYNRWGQLLFHSDGYNTPWDGTYDGKPVPIGTYYYIINLNDPRFPKAMTGPLTILR